MSNANLFDSKATVNAGLLDISQNFTLGSDGKQTVLSVGGGNSIKAGSQLILNAGGKDGSTTLAFNLSSDNYLDKRASTESDYQKVAALNFVSNSGIQLTNSVGGKAIQLDLLNQASDLTGGIYTLLYSDKALTAGIFDLTLKDFNSRTENRDRFNAMFLEQTSNAVILEKGMVYNGIANWVGSNSNEWDTVNHNWDTTDSKGQKWSEFSEGDYANFAITDRDQVHINVAADAGSNALFGIRSSGIYFSGSAEYIIDGRLSAIPSRDIENHQSSGKLVLGQKVVWDENGGISYQNNDFTGIVDLTNTAGNRFSGIDIYGGTLKFSSTDQIRSSALTQFSFLGEGGTLLVAAGSDVRLGLPLRVESGSTAYIQTEDDGKLTLAGGLGTSSPTAQSGIYGKLVVEGREDNYINFDNSTVQLGENTVSNPNFKSELVLDYVNLSKSGVTALSGTKSVSITNASFEDNFNGTGQAINIASVGGTHLHLDNVRFTNIQQGTAIDLRNADEGNEANTAYFNNVHFVDNGEQDLSFVQPSYLIGSNIGFKMLNSSFVNNNIEMGGVINLTDIDSQVEIENTEFSGNTHLVYNDYAVSNGGAIYLNNYTSNLNNKLLLTDVIFDGNKTVLTDTIAVESIEGGSGGAIYLASASMDIKGDSNFLNNSAANRGGAIFSEIDSRSPNKIPTVNIENTNFTGNKAQFGGGAIYGDFAELNITDSDFTGNITAKGQGGAINYSGTLNLTATQDMTFTGNMANGISSGIHLQDNAILNINVAEGKTLTMADVLSGQNDTRVVKNGAGTWHLAGNSQFDNRNTFSINEGVWDLAKDASLSFKLGHGSQLYLGSNNKHTTIVVGGNNHLETRSGSITLNKGSNDSEGLTFNIKVSDENKIGDISKATKDSAALSLYGSLWLVGSNKITLDVDLSSIQSGEAGSGLYSLVYSEHGEMKEEHFALNQDLTYRGENISNIERLKGLSLQFSADQKSIILENGQNDGKILTAIANWTGQDDTWRTNGSWHTINSAGEAVSRSIFVSGDFAQFALTKADGFTDLQEITLETDAGKVDTAGIYISGDADYRFDGEGLNASKHQTTFNPAESSGKLVLGQEIVSNKADVSYNNKDYSGTLDLTTTDINNFEGGVDIYGGTLKISHQDQLGTTLDQLKLAGTNKDNAATLLVAENGNVTFKDQSLTIGVGKYAAIKAEDNSQLTFEKLSSNNIVNSGNLLISGTEDSKIRFRDNNGLINSSGSLDINNAEFISNTNFGLNLSGSNIVSNTLFEENSYTGNAVDTLHLGGGGKITVNNVAFQDNNQRAISLDNNGNNQLFVSNSLFKNLNISYGNAGAIDLYRARYFEIADSIFDSNHTAYEGGAIAFSAGSKMSLMIKLLKIISLFKIVQKD